MSFISKLRQRRKFARAQKRMAYLGRIMDTIDMALVKNRYTTEQRLEFWMRFIGDRAYRLEVIEKMVEQHKGET